MTHRDPTGDPRDPNLGRDPRLGTGGLMREFSVADLQQYETLRADRGAVAIYVKK